jgi:transposase-like protein
MARTSNAQDEWARSVPATPVTGQMKDTPRKVVSILESRLELPTPAWLRPTEPVQYSQYSRFPLSFREVEELILERGVAVSYDTIRRWCAKFGHAYASGLRRRRPRPGDKWHCDEVFIRINGTRHYLWRGRPARQRARHSGPVPPKCGAAKRFFRKLLKNLEYVPRVIVATRSPTASCWHLSSIAARST